MNPALWVSKTGVQAQDAKLQAIANNLANVNTVGFKRDRVVFEDLFYQIDAQPGAQTADNTVSNGVQLGNGVHVVGNSSRDGDERIGAWVEPSCETGREQARLRLRIPAATAREMIADAEHQRDVACGDSMRDQHGHVHVARGCHEHAGTLAAKVSHDRAESQEELDAARKTRERRASLRRARPRRASGHAQVPELEPTRSRAAADPCSPGGAVGPANAAVRSLGGGVLAVVDPPPPPAIGTAAIRPRRRPPRPRGRPAPGRRA